jgi:hypothetical protein
MLGSHERRIPTLAAVVAWLMPATAAWLMPAPATAITFYYDTYGGFLEGTQSANPFPSPVFLGTRDARDAANQATGDGDDAWSRFGWGTGPNAPSYVDALPEEDQAVDVDGGRVIFGTLQHFNQVIAEWWEPGDTSPGMGEGPATIEVSWNLDLYATLMDAQMDAGPIGSFSFLFELSFFETHNDAPCTTSIAGFDRDHVTVCDDLFYVSRVQGSDGIWMDVVGGVFSFNESFSHMGQGYRLKGEGFYEGGVLTGDHWSCEGTGVPCVADVRFRIATPEPAPALLFCAALVGLGAARRRRA